MISLNANVCKSRCNNKQELRLLAQCRVVSGEGQDARWGKDGILFPCRPPPGPPVRPAPGGRHSGWACSGPRHQAPCKGAVPWGMTVPWEWGLAPDAFPLGMISATSCRTREKNSTHLSRHTQIPPSRLCSRTSPYTVILQAGFLICRRASISWGPCERQLMHSEHLESHGSQKGSERAGRSHESIVFHGRRRHGSASTAWDFAHPGSSGHSSRRSRRT